MRRARSALLFAFVAAFLAGCSGTDDITGPSNGQVQADVSAGAAAVAISGPGADASGATVVDLMNLLQAPPAPMVTGDVAPLEVPLDCPATFDLPSGISGTCTTSPEGVSTFVFGGTIDADGDSVTVDGTLVAAPVVDQPETGAIYTIDFDATATGSRGTATWSVLGTVTFNEDSQVVDYSFTMTHTVTPTGGSTAVVNAVVSPSEFELVVTGPRGGVLRFDFDRDTMTGVVSLNGIPVAGISVEGGCTTIDYYNPAIPDETVCSEEAS